MVVNYQLGKIYTVRSLTSPEIYVGSTCAPLCKRMAKHRSSWKQGLILGKNKNIVSDINEWFIELYENYQCDKVEELTAREGVIIREIGTLNKRIEGRTQKEYYIDNIDKRKDYDKEYRIENADKRKKQMKEYYIENVDKKKEYNIKNANKKKEYDKEYSLENVNKIKETKKAYYLKNADKIKEYKIENANKIKETNKQYHLKKKLEKAKKEETI